MNIAYMTVTTRLGINTIYQCLSGIFAINIANHLVDEVAWPDKAGLKRLRQGVCLGIFHHNCLKVTPPDFYAL